MAEGRRRFTKRERLALFLAANGRSELSGEPLPNDWHADHVVPWSKGGETNLANAQALTPKENLMKGAKEGLRKWQARFVDAWRGDDKVDFLLAALPAAGKTHAALHVANGFLDEDHSRRLVIVVPTAELRRQWRDCASKVFGIELMTKEFSGNLKVGRDGVVITYQSLGKHYFEFIRFCSKHQTMVVFDEIHHAEDSASWGIGVKEGFAAAVRRLSMTGTPFRSKPNERISFLRIDGDSNYITDFKYDYPQALEDGVVRYIAFNKYNGSWTDADSGMVRQFPCKTEEQNDWLLIRLIRDENYVRGFLQAAHERLLAQRTIKPNAGGLILAIDMGHARWLRGLMQDITGRKPDIVLSDNPDDEDPDDTITKFRDHSSEWIVAVKMISEGVDIKRLMALAYLTNVKSRLFFRQAVGRVMRREPDDRRLGAVVVMPEHPELIVHAAEIEKFQADVQTSSGNPRPPREPKEPGDPYFEPDGFASEPEFSGTILSGEPVETEEAGKLREVSMAHGISENELRDILADLFGNPKKQDSPSDEEREDELRKKCNRLVGSYANLTGEDFRDVHMKFKRQEDMTVAQLEQKEARLIEMIRQARQQRRPKGK